MKNNAEIRLWEGFGLAASHILASPVGTLFLVVYLARDAGVAVASQGNFLALTFIGLGFATIFQAMRGRFIGSGFLAVSGFSTSYTAILLVAAKAGGLPLVAGMTVFAGIVEIVIAPVLPYVRVLFPASVLTVILALIGIYVGEVGIDLLTGIHEVQFADLIVHAIAALIVLLIFGLTVWGTKQLRRMALLIGMTAGFILLWVFNLIPADPDATLLSHVWLQWPSPWTHSIAFDAKFALPFALVPMVVAIRHIGLVSTLQRETRIDWQEADMGNVARAQFAGGLGTLLSGLLGAGPTAIGSNSVALATQSKVYDRWIGFLGGSLLLLVGLTPAVYTLLLVIPDPLLGAALLALGASMLVSALRLVDFRQIQAQDMLIVGTGVILGIHVEIHENVYRSLGPEIIQNIASSGMIVGVIGASALNSFFLLGKIVGTSGHD